MELYWMDTTAYAFSDAVVNVDGIPRDIMEKEQE